MLSIRVVVTITTSLPLPLELRLMSGKQGREDDADEAKGNI